MRANLLNLMFILIVLLLVSPFLAAFCTGGEHRKLVPPASAQDRAYADAVAAQADAYFAAVEAQQAYCDAVLEAVKAVNGKAAKAEVDAKIAAADTAKATAATAKNAAKTAKDAKDGKKPK